ncbi:MAG TPA: N-methyl-L-tryptophan oxidase [Solirubrobacteraceae bacterium]|nr:N-methyl-L-tryptophan oxidase [Solirubrobacteraceae bacterium]
MERFDLAIVGLGAMGSATAWHAARSGARVIGLDRWTPPHAHGSTHGDTRITRLAIGEGAQYGPLAVRSHELWREIEAATGAELLVECGGVVLGAAGARGQHGADDFLGATLEAGRAHGIAVEELDADALADAVPPFALRGDERGVYEPTAGYVRPEAAVAAQLELAASCGADLRYGARVVAVGEGQVELHDGTVVHADRIVLSAGAWLPVLRPELARAFTVTRQVLHWFALAPGASYAAHRDLPVYIWLTGDGPEELFYGFPAIDGPGGGVKVASEQFARPLADPGTVERAVAPDESAAMHARYLAGRLPGLAPRTVKARACLYTTTTDSGFAIDVHPEDETLLVVSPCSGHGFKHSAAIGEAVAQLALTGASAIDLSPFGLGRLL